MTLTCTACGKSYGDSEWIWRCPCGGYLQIAARPAFDPGRIRTATRSLWRYRDLLPLRVKETVTLEEGWTPLTSARWAGRDVGFKLDFVNPTGSYKDRGATLQVSFLKGLGLTHVHDDSSGNAGAALAAYAARAGLACDIYCPAHASAGKLVQIRAYGARLVQVPGTRQDVSRASERAPTSYASHNWHPLYAEGVKTFAWEIWEQMDRRAPDVLVAPAGFGSILLGAYLAFSELRAAGLISTLPRLYAGQAATCAPLHTALAQGLSHVPAVPRGDTLAEGIACDQPVRGRELLEAIRESKGGTELVTDAEIVEALRDLARLGIYVEPTSAVAPVVFNKLVAAGAIGRDETAVILLSGTGLKATDKLLQYFSS